MGMNICFYLMLKAEGKFVKIHPVIKHLVRIRKLLSEQKINEKERQKNKVRKEKEKLKKIEEKRKQKMKKMEAKRKKKKKKKKTDQRKKKQIEQTKREENDDGLVTVTFRPGAIGMKYTKNRITEIEEGSQAARKGVCPGWFISHVNGEFQKADTLLIDKAIDKTYNNNQPTQISFNPHRAPKQPKEKNEDDSDEDLEYNRIMRLVETETDVNTRLKRGHHFTQVFNAIKEKENGLEEDPEEEISDETQDPDRRRRSASNRHMNFRGIVRPRNKKRKIPRTQLRNKVHKAKIKRQSVIQDFVPGKTKTLNYHGEETGLKKTTIKSRKIVY